MRWFSRCGVSAAWLLLLSVAYSQLEPVITEDGLRIDVMYSVECGRKTQNGDTIHVHYNGTLEDGTPFDSSYGRNMPFAFRLGAGRVIAGWDKGLLNMCVGEERRLTIPPEMAYGNRAMGVIPASSTLVFGTKLMAIDGVPDQSPIVPPIPSITSIPPVSSPTSSSIPETTSASAPTITPTATPLPPDGGEPGSENGECRLLGPFALVVQAGLGVLAMLSLVFKRFRERPRRPVKIWFFDASKQVFGSVLLHILNLVMSMFSSGDFELASKAHQLSTQFQDQINMQLQDDDGRRPNPCSFYLINLAIDTTIGIPILVILLRLLHHAFSQTPLANPPESIRSGHYGQPPRASWWLKQSIIYFLGLFLMKLCVLLIFALLPWIAWVGDWALRWTEGSEALQIAFVMFVFPVIMNAIQYYIIDSFIKDTSASDHQLIPSSERDSDDRDDHGDDVSDDGNYDSERSAADGHRSKRAAEVKADSVHDAVEDLEDKDSGKASSSAPSVTIGKGAVTSRKGS